MSAALPEMKAIRPVLDMYMNAAVAVVGCHSLGVERGSCELDLLVVTDESRPPTTARLGKMHVDLYFSSEKEALKPSNPEYSVALAFAKPIKDASLVLSTSLTANTAVLVDSSRRSARARLASSLKALGRSEDALARSSTKEADFWLQAASYDYAYAWVYSSDSMPCPSHLLGQLRGISKGVHRGFEAFTKGAGLELGSRMSSASRADGIGIIHDLIRRRKEPGPADQSSWSMARTDVVKAKADDLSQAGELAECYSYLGIESLRALAGLTRRTSRGPVGDPGQQRITALFAGDKKLLGDALLSELGYGRDRKKLEEGFQALKEQVPRLSKRV